MHNREIHQRCDDSVTCVSGGKPRIIRRSRGYVPMPIFLDDRAVETLATGGELKNTVCLTKENRAFVSQHIGDMENLETFDFFKATIRHLESILEIHPRILAHDLHPDYMTSVFAREEEHRFEKRIAVQHHHAHIASCMGEHGLEGPVIGLAMDGTGYAEDGTVWGGEVLLAYADRYQRWGHFANQLMPGGEKGDQGTLAHGCKPSLPHLRRKDEIVEPGFVAKDRRWQSGRSGADDGQRHTHAPDVQLRTAVRRGLQPSRNSRCGNV